MEKSGRLILALLGFWGSACAVEEPAPPGPGEGLGERAQAVKAPLAEAYCDAVVTGVGTISTEDDYLPHVITCENGGADIEALKAQAIAARSVLYYGMATKGSICDGQGCQVYTCGAAPQAKHIQAVNETKGQYLSFADTLTYGFFVAGDNTPVTSTCKGEPGAASTEKYVTYNEGKSGPDVQQTTLGYVGPPGFGQNRGCLGQWSSRCLEKNKGYNYKQILQFFYGDDIQILTAPGCGGCTPHCNGSKIVGADCGEGDCAAFGSTCVDDALGVRCVFGACPATGEAEVCIDEKTIGHCKDGAVSTGDCSQFAAVCTKAGTPHCASVFCGATADSVPPAHDVCSLNGGIWHCDDQGNPTEEPCPAGLSCKDEGGKPSCVDPNASAAGSGGAGQAGSGQAGSGAPGGSGPGGSPAAGQGGAAGKGGSGQAGSGQAGSGQPGSGAAGKGGSAAGKGGASGSGTAGQKAGGAGGQKAGSGGESSGLPGSVTISREGEDEGGGCGCRQAPAGEARGAWLLAALLLRPSRRAARGRCAPR